MFLRIMYGHEKESVQRGMVLIFGIQKLFKKLSADLPDYQVFVGQIHQISNGLIFRSFKS